ncbi:protein GDAP2 homolog [Pomacea canaliculata]|uniref:protein GDAP2 homolog n=1 Tax=Pomacea canaliculata TaxID=400727 RepID=UPI000D7356D8|nr:protein GDAP2 homolog [Pomacea canaliculata]
MEPLGARDDVINIDSLTRWNLTLLPEASERQNENEREQSPFTWRNDLNSKIILCSCNITRLSAHAIVHSCNEHLNDRNPISDEIFRQGGPGLLKEVREDIKVCKTGEAKLTKGYNLPARYVIHTVGPRYNLKYITAAESALFSCYRNTLQLCRENGIRSLGLSCIHTLGRGYPPEGGAHIALRTVRRFLEKYPDTLDTLLFVCTDDNLEVYRRLLPLYFPRSIKEEEESIPKLPKDIGNEDGEPIIEERQIRIIDKPTFAAYRSEGIKDFDETIDLNERFMTSGAVDVGHHPFASMEENPDKNKTKVLQGISTEEYRRAETRRRYEALLEKARKEDLTDIAAFRCLYRSGVDRQGRPVIVFVGKNFSAINTDPERALLYMIKVMEAIVDGPYVVVYFHTLTSRANHPPMSYMKLAYSVLDHRYKKNLKSFYIIHPTLWSKFATWFFTTFTASDIKRKVHSLNGVQYLYTKINPDQLDIPQFIHEYDIRINGPRYFVPEPESVDEL